MKKNTFIMLFFILGLGTLFAQKFKPLFPQMPGMVSYTCRNSFAKVVEARLDSIKVLGITGMEFSNQFAKKALEI